MYFGLILLLSILLSGLLELLFIQASTTKSNLTLISYKYIKNIVQNHAFIFQIKIIWYIDEKDDDEKEFFVNNNHY